MKYKVIVIIALAVLGVFLFVKFPELNQTQLIESVPEPTVEDGGHYEFVYQGRILKVSLFGIDERLELIPNFSEKISTKDAKDFYNCEALSSAGFYKEDGMPVGLFVTLGNELSNGYKNATFNGVIYMDRQGDINIENYDNYDNSYDRLKFALQTGPILIKNRDVLKLKLVNDKNARRLVMVKTDENEFIMVIYDSQSQLAGLYLDDLGDSLIMIANGLGFSIIDAINLDGGNASGFYTNRLVLTEFTKVGSFFCLVKN